MEKADCIQLDSLVRKWTVTLRHHFQIHLIIDIKIIFTKNKMRCVSDDAHWRFNIGSIKTWCRQTTFQMECRDWVFKFAKNIGKTTTFIFFVESGRNLQQSITSAHVILVDNARQYCTGVISDSFNSLVPQLYTLNDSTGIAALKQKCRHFVEIFITGCTGSCHFDNFQCSQWWTFHQNEDFSVSVSPTNGHRGACPDIVKINSSYLFCVLSMMLQPVSIKNIICRKKTRKCARKRACDVSSFNLYATTNHHTHTHRSHNK